MCHVSTMFNLNKKHILSLVSPPVHCHKYQKKRNTDWLVVYLPLWKIIEFVNGFRMTTHIWNGKNMFETTNFHNMITSNVHDIWITSNNKIWNIMKPPISWCHFFPLDFHVPSVAIRLSSTAPPTPPTVEARRAWKRSIPSVGVSVTPWFWG